MAPPTSLPDPSSVLLCCSPHPKSLPIPPPSCLGEQLNGLAQQRGAGQQQRMAGGLDQFGEELREGQNRWGGKLCVTWIGTGLNTGMRLI